jgi:hypothetical protein
MAMNNEWYRKNYGMLGCAHPDRPRRDRRDRQFHRRSVMLNARAKNFLSHAAMVPRRRQIALDVKEAVQT